MIYRAPALRKAYINLEEVCGNSISVVQGLFLTAMVTIVGFVKHS